MYVSLPLAHQVTPVPSVAWMATEGEICPGPLNMLRADNVSLRSGGGRDGKAYVPAMVLMELSHVGWAARGDSGEGVLLVTGFAMTRAEC